MIDAATLPVPPHPPTPDDDRREKEKRIRVSSSGSSPHGGCSITISGLTSEEKDRFEAAAHGHNWVTVSTKGRLRAIPTYKPLPDPVEDPMMQPFWRLPVAGVETQLRTISMDPIQDYQSPSITIQHLCGYGYTAERYVSNAKNLTRWGFLCLRSQRNESGRYYELWYLPFLLAAQHELKTAIVAASPEKGSSLSKKCHFEAAMSFLMRNVSFGTLDASFQRAAMTID